MCVTMFQWLVDVYFYIIPMKIIHVEFLNLLSIMQKNFLYTISENADYSPIMNFCYHLHVAHKETGAEYSGLGALDTDSESCREVGYHLVLFLIVHL